MSASRDRNKGQLSSSLRRRLNKWFISSAVLVLAAIGLVAISGRIHFSLMAEALYWTLTICLFAIGLVFFASALRVRSLVRNQLRRDADE